MNQWSFFPLLRLLSLVSAFLGIFTASHYYVKCGLPVCKKTFSLKCIVCTIFIILLGKEISTHSGVLAWRIPWTEELGRLQSMGSQRVRHD